MCPTEDKIEDPIEKAEAEEATEEKDSREAPEVTEEEALAEGVDTEEEIPKGKEKEYGIQ